MGEKRKSRAGLDEWVSEARKQNNNGRSDDGSCSLYGPEDRQDQIWMALSVVPGNAAASPPQTRKYRDVLWFLSLRIKQLFG
jgi:hypothetical protein